MPLGRRARQLLNVILYFVDHCRIDPPVACLQDFSAAGIRIRVACAMTWVVRFDIWDRNPQFFALLGTGPFRPISKSIPK